MRKVPQAVLLTDLAIQSKRKEVFGRNLIAREVVLTVLPAPGTHESNGQMIRPLGSGHKGKNGATFGLIAKGGGAVQGPVTPGGQGAGF